MTEPTSLFAWFRSAALLRTWLTRVVALSLVLNLAAGTFSGVVHAHDHDHVVEHHHHHDDEPEDAARNSEVSAQIKPSAPASDSGGHMHEHATDIVLSMFEPLTWTFDRSDTRWLVLPEPRHIAQIGYPAERPPRRS